MLEKSKLGSRFKLNKHEADDSNSYNTIGLNDDCKSISDSNKLEGKDDKINSEIRQALVKKIKSIPVWYNYSNDRQLELIKAFVVN